MQRTGRKNPRLQEKLDALKRELARVETDIKGISRAVETPDPERAIRQLRQVPRDPLPRETPVMSRPAGPATVNQAPSSSFDIPPPSPDVQLPKTVPDQKFATYFGSSSLHSVRPLRQERRVQRNKALFMLGMAFILLYVLYHVLF